MAPKFKTVIFDLDGTLVDSIGSIQCSINEVLADHGYPTHDREAVKGFINFGSVELVRRALPEDKRTDEEIERIHSIYSPILAKNSATNCLVYDGIIELCKKLKAEGVKIAVLTNKPEAAAKNCINTYLPEAQFDEIRGMVPGKFVKPDPAFTEDIMKTLDAQKETTLYVGDSVVDVKTAHNAGILCAGVCWGFHGEKGFLDQVPDFRVWNTDELYNVIMG